MLLTVDLEENGSPPKGFFSAFVGTLKGSPAGVGDLNGSVDPVPAEKLNGSEAGEADFLSVLELKGSLTLNGSVDPCHKNK